MRRLFIILGTVAALVGCGGDSGANKGLLGSPNPPSKPIALAQLRSDGVTDIPVGGTTTETAVKFRASISGSISDLRRSVQLQVQVALVGDDDFSGLVRTTSSPFAVGGPGVGGPVTVSMTQLGVNPYHWRARTIDGLGNVSAWVSFGGNPESSPDFSVIQ